MKNLNWYKIDYRVVEFSEIKLLNEFKICLYKDYFGKDV